AEGLKKPLSSWQVPEEKLRKDWRSGLLSTGYFVVLPWQTWPTTEKLRIVVQFILADGRIFEADKDVTIRLPPNRKGIPLPPPTPLPPPRPAGPPIPGCARPAVGSPGFSRLKPGLPTY